MLLSVSGGRRKYPYNGDKLRARAETRAIKLYRYHYTVSCEFPTFPDTIDNQLLPLLLTLKNAKQARQPPLQREVCYSTIAGAKIQIKTENSFWQS